MIKKIRCGKSTGLKNEKIPAYAGIFISNVKYPHMRVWKNTTKADLRLKSYRCVLPFIFLDFSDEQQRL